MPTIKTDVDFEVFCAECGTGMCKSVSVHTYHGNHQLRIAPCQKCLDSANESGYNNGVKDGYEDCVKERSE